MNKKTVIAKMLFAGACLTVSYYLMGLAIVELKGAVKK